MSLNGRLEFRHRILGVVALVVAAFCAANSLFGWKLFGEADKYVMMANVFGLLVVFYICLGSGTSSKNQDARGDAVNSDAETRTSVRSRTFLRVYVPVAVVVMLAPSISWAVRDMPGGWLGILKTEIFVVAALFVFWHRFGRRPR